MPTASMEQGALAFFSTLPRGLFRQLISGLADCSDLPVGVFNHLGSLFSGWIVDGGGQKVPVSHQDKIKMLPFLLCLLDICTVIKSPSNLGLHFTPKCHVNLQKA